MNIVGASIPRIDSQTKALGQAQYAGDIQFPGMLHGAILRSTLPHARIKSIDISRAKQLPGVKAIITGADTLGKTFGTLRWREKFMDEQALATDKVRYIGDPIAAVAAIDADVALEALELIEVDYEELKPVFTMDDALEEGAPLVHEDSPGNLSKGNTLDFGVMEEAWSRSAVVREDGFETVANAHLPLETHTCVAVCEPPDKITIWTSTQVPYLVQSDLARTLGIPTHNIRVILPRVGGGFGGKSDGMFALDFCAALLAIKTGRAVGIAYSREEEFISTRKRHPARIYLKTGITEDGHLTGRLARCDIDGGAYNGFGPATIALCGMFLNLPYRYQAFRYEGRRIYTNNPTSSAMRGHGAPQVQFASDMQLNLLAEAIGMDPVEVRLKNALTTGETTINGMYIISSGLKECIARVAQASGWYTKRGKLPRGHGIGIGCSGFPSGTGYRHRPDIPTYSSAIVRLNDDGSVGLLSGATDTGQGVETLLTQIVAEELGILPQWIRYQRPDTAITPADLGNFSSRETVYAGNAVKAAASKLKGFILEMAEEILKIRQEELVCQDDQIFASENPAKYITFTEVVQQLMEKRKGRPVVGEGSYDPPDKAYYATYTFGAQITEVEVDDETGAVAIKKIYSAHDCGRAINPMSVEGQLEGSVHMGLGFAMAEEMVLKDGQAFNASCLNYGILDPSQMPEVAIYHIDSNDTEGPFGAKEAGEGTVGPVAPALAGAIYNATGQCINRLPIRPWSIMYFYEV